MLQLLMLVLVNPFIALLETAAVRDAGANI